MISRIRSFVEEKQMIQPKDKVLVGISGGPDSVCLLFVLLELQKELDFEITAVHVHHGLRGTEADRDEAFVRELCQEQKVTLHTCFCRVRERAEREKLSLEEAGRLCRYEIFEQEAEKEGCSRIAVAHHANDQAETMLFHLFRGTGLKGLCGMEAVRGKIIRPLLCVERKEILSWLEERRIPWCTDSTNLEENYTRNRIRHSILACAEAEVNVRAVRHMAQTAEELSAIEQFLEEETQKAFARYVRAEEKSCFVSEEAGWDLSPLVAGRMYRTCLARYGGLKDIERQHILFLGELMEKQTGSRLSLPGKRKAVKVYGGLRLLEAQEDAGGQQPAVFAPTIPGACRTGEITWVFSLENAEKYQRIPEKTYTKWFDYDKIKKSLNIRRRMPGDYLEINQAHGRKKLKDYLIDQKIPSEERDQLWLLADGSHILWIVGKRISEGYKVTEETKQILKVQIYGGKENG